MKRYFDATDGLIVRKEYLHRNIKQLVVVSVDGIGECYGKNRCRVQIEIHLGQMLHDGCVRRGDNGRRSNKGNVEHRLPIQRFLADVSSDQANEVSESSDG